MAVFSATTSSNKYITIELETRVDSQSVANNTTTISWWLRVKKSSSSTSATWGNCSYAANVGGQQKSGSGNISVSAGGTTALLSGQVTVPHNADGTLTISVSASISGKIVGSVSGTQPMTTIPRASSISAPAFTLGSAGTITINRASSAFTHTIEYSYGNQKGTVVSKTTATSVSWTPPISLASQTPSATKGTGTLTCTTYSGSTAVGSKAISFSASVPSSVVPSISSVTVSEAVSGLAAQFGAYVQRKSRLRIKTSASGAYGSTISSCSVKVDGGTYSGTDVTSNIINSSGTVSITATVTDSRGRSASKTVSVSVTAYTAPAITSLSAHRCNADGTDNVNGDYVYIDYAYNIAAVGNKNTHSATLSVKRSSGSDWTQVASNSAYSANTHVVPSQQFLSDYQFDVRLYVADYFDSTTMTARVPTAETILDISADGTTVACGKTAEEANTFDCEKLIIARKGFKDLPPIGGEELTGDFNNYIMQGKYIQRYDSNMANILNRPSRAAGALYCIFPLNPSDTTLAGAGVKYLIQIFVTYTGLIFLRSADSTNGPVTWGDWKEILHTGNNDYIVASGTSGIWRYIKWANGATVCWGSVSVPYVNKWVLETDVAKPYTIYDERYAGSIPSTTYTVNELQYNLKIRTNPDASGYVLVNVHSAAADFASGSSVTASVIVFGRWK